MYDIGLVDSTGIFLSTVDESTIARYCGEEESLAHYLNTAYSIFMICQTKRWGFGVTN